EEKALKWLRYGAKPTDTALRLLSKAGIMDKFKPTAVKKSRAAKSTRSKTRAKAKTKTKSTTEESS
ncbi:MAG: 30S ribosomal protein S16, partial [Chloroflexi bacterium]|nr:30S ribosomal protein S16 [Chloroflexota bacterium]